MLCYYHLYLLAVVYCLILWFISYYKNLCVFFISTIIFVCLSSFSWLLVAKWNNGFHYDFYTQVPCSCSDLPLLVILTCGLSTMWSNMSNIFIFLLAFCKQIPMWWKITQWEEGMQEGFCHSHSQALQLSMSTGLWSTLHGSLAWLKRSALACDTKTWVIRASESTVKNKTFL